MALHVSYLAAAFFVALVSVHKFFVYPAFFSPLAKVPYAHWSCTFCPFWIYWKRWNHGENGAVYKLHMEKGPLIRLAPNLLSVNCFEDGLKTIYQGGFPKPIFYPRGFCIYGIDNIFTLLDNATHAARKRSISNTFSKSFILGSRTTLMATRDVLFGRYLPLVYKAAVEDKPLETLELNYSLSMDVFVQWQFGRSISSNFLEDEKERKMYLNGFFATHGYTFWQYYFPDFANWLRRVGIFLIPRWVDVAFGALEEWNLKKCDEAQQLLASGEKLASEDQPVIFEQAMKAMSQVDSKPREYPRRMEIASDMFAHSSAAFETSGNTETYLFYEMSRHPEWQTKLRQELLTLDRPLKFAPGKDYILEDFPLAKDVDALPILHAVIMETMRLWPSVPGGQPRVVPKPCNLGGYHNIPAGTVVQSYAWVLHQTPSIFPEPTEWKPDRWLNASAEELSIMKKWFWAFGSGGRMCIGSHFAFYTMKWVVGSIYTNFTTTIHDHGDMELIDNYLAGPKGHRLEIKFHPVH